MKKVGEVVRYIEKLAPSGTAESWDNVGLLVGDPKWSTSGAVISIDLTREALRTAARRKFRLVVTHHPPIFPKSKGLSRITADAEGAASLVFEAISSGIAVFSCHTNFDRCALEVVENVSRALGASPQGRLIERPVGSLTKLSVFVPSTHLEQVRVALVQGGAGQIGHYDSCTFSTVGEGTFRGGDATSPFLGRPGMLERAQEHRLETIFPRGLEKQVLGALREAHPYEEIAYDLYPVEQGPASGGIVRGLGYGFWGDLTKGPTTFKEIARKIQKAFQVSGFWITEPVPRKVKRIAFVAGKGASFVQAAAMQGCDLFITGEAGYHTALDGLRRGMSVMEIGHRESERFFLSTLGDWFSNIGLKTAELNIPTQRVWPAQGI